MKKKVIIIGAGISGLYLASLIEKHFEVTILEARGRIGGRIHSIDGNDMGPSWIWSHQKHILALVQELGLELFAQSQDGYALYDTTDKVSKFNKAPSAPSARMKGTLTTLIQTLKRNLMTTKILLCTEVLSLSEEQSKVLVQTHTGNFEVDFVVNTLPPRLAQKIEYKPALPQVLEDKMIGTPTWMGNSTKCVVEFTKQFWKEKGLSGFVVSHKGPLSEIHDASEGNKYALFGFMHTNANKHNLKKSVTEQMIRLFEIQEEDILNIYLIDWRDEQFSSVIEDRKFLQAHPNYGIDTKYLNQKIFFSSTEFSYDNGGYIEGAIIQAKECAKRLHLLL